MECRRFRITLISANDLPAVQDSGKTRVYAKVSLDGKRKTEKRTPADKEGQINPRWNFTLWYKVAEALIQQEDVNIAIKLYAENNLRDKYVGELNLPLKNLFDNGLTAEKVSYALEHKSSDASFSKGTLQMSYSFGEKIIVKNLAGWKKAADYGATILLKGTCLLVFGFVVEEEDDVGDHDVLVKP
ncbi:protein SRC2 homolog [Coffea arabica]|uniref:Protein SRC2 homolog n=1 Tax=Coffea arabica TaxID=13443 RepID=A0A6P6UL09_COFAR|nr:protein SRC2 homolog [Coffea arabica]